LNTEKRAGFRETIRKGRARRRDRKKSVEKQRVLGRIRVRDDRKDSHLKVRKAGTPEQLFGRPDLVAENSRSGKIRKNHFENRSDPE